MSISVSTRVGRTRLAVVGALLVLIALVAGVLLGRATDGGAAAPPSDTSAEAGFARDMQIHHSQAVDMAILVRDATDDPEVRLLALDIMTGQSQQMGQMYAWLVSWNLPQTSRQQEMAWMARPALDGAHDEHSDAHTPGEPMPGLATAAQMTALAASEGVEAERLFLELMTAHHLGGVEMAEAVLARSELTLVTNLATGMAKLQAKEVDYMRDLLDARS